MARNNSSSHALSRGGRSTGSDRAAGGAYTSRSAGAPVEALGSDIRLTLPARPENVAVVRHVFGAFAEALGLPSGVRDDVRLAVTEACTNVVRHAYGGDDGMIDVVMRPQGATIEAIEVIVADGGRGHGPSPDTAGPGLGLSLIAALADSLEVERSPGMGSRLVMGFRRHRPQPLGLA
jgi:anti-sigma regulatory factor (Ser/Thr protein kinase)